MHDTNVAPLLLDLVKEYEMRADQAAQRSGLEPKTTPHSDWRAYMTATITDVKCDLRSKQLGDLRCWHVGYNFCDLFAEIIVYADNEADARAKAVDQLRRRGLKLAAAG
jgi:hypothetical protein